MKKRVFPIVIFSLILMAVLYWGRIFIYLGVYLIETSITPAEPAVTEGKNDWQYTLTDGTKIGIGMSYGTHPGFIDNYIWSNQKVHIFMRSGNRKTIIRTIDVSKYKPDGADHYDVIKVEPDDKGCRILYYWFGPKGYHPQVLRNIPLDPKTKWEGQVDWLSVQDYITEDFKKNYMNTRL